MNKPLYLAFTLLLLVTGCKKETNFQNITIGTFGGSVSSRPESSYAREIWSASLMDDNIIAHIESNGVDGAGFSIKTGDNNIYNQIIKSKTYDVYILWASTNDNYVAAVGDVNSTDSTTQNGGINRVIKTIKLKNPNALILFLTSLPRFGGLAYPKTHRYSVEQAKVCELQNIPYLFQYGLNLFTYENRARYYLDFAHFNKEGYTLIAPYQANFIKKHTKIWLHENKK